MRPRPHPSHRKRGTLSKAEFAQILERDKAETKKAWEEFAKEHPAKAKETEARCADLIAELEREGE